MLSSRISFKVFLLFKSEPPSDRLPLAIYPARRVCRSAGVSHLETDKDSFKGNRYAYLQTMTLHVAWHCLSVSRVFSVLRESIDRTFIVGNAKQNTNRTLVLERGDKLQPLQNTFRSFSKNLRWWCHVQWIRWGQWGLLVKVSSLARNALVCLHLSECLSLSIKSLSLSLSLLNIFLSIKCSDFLDCFCYFTNRVAQPLVSSSLCVLRNPRNDS